MEEPNSSKTPRQQLSKGMEHIRHFVTADPTTRSTAATPTPPNLSATSPDPATPGESDAYGVPASLQPPRQASSRSHDPSNNEKRTDPFQFGSRFLEEGDDVFEFNAWDHVEVTDEYKEFASMQYAKQREAPVSDFDRRRFNNDPARWWDLFYKNNTANFFKNRKWLKQEFPLLSEITAEDAPPALLLEVGAGAGNTAFPILAENKNPGLKIHACDFAKKAVEVIRANEAYDEKYIRADVWDVAATGEGSLPPGIEEGSVDVAIMIFVFSALAPTQWAQAVRNIWRILKPGGQVLFRDYGRGDLAQVRFKKGRYLEENFYVRGDGTRVYFFEKEELEKIWSGHCHELLNERGAPSDEENTTENEQTDPVETPTNGLDSDTPAFEIINIGVDRRMLVNRQRRLKMYRCWMQARFQKPHAIEVASENSSHDKVETEQR